MHHSILRSCLAILGAALLPSMPAAQTPPPCTVANNATCGAAVNLGTINGDSSSAQIVRSGLGGAHFRVRVRESSSSLKALNARVQLAVPAGINYDLYVRCASCTSNAMRSSINGAGVAELVAVTKADNWTGDDSFDLFIEVRYYSGQSCSQWTLTVAGYTAATQGALACQ